MGGFAIHSHESSMGIHVSPPSQTPLHRLPYPIHLCCPKAPVLGTLLHALNLYWSSVLHMVMYVFQCYSLKSPHPLLTLSLKVCYLHLCLLCCPACRIIGFVFLNSIYMRQYPVLVFLFLTYFTLYNKLQFYPPHWN